MKGQKYLGIYISEDRATVVFLGQQGRDYMLLGSFSVSVEGEEGGLRELGSMIGKSCSEKLEIDENVEVVMSLDCGLFMQHSVHSEFQELRQIRQTVRFDTEEALASDISDSAIGFEVTSSDERGSDLAVFTVRHKIMSDILISLRSNNIDPVVVEPDVKSLTRYILRKSPLKEGTTDLYCILSNQRGYFVVPSSSSKDHKTSPRTFLLNSRQDRNSLVMREIPLTMAAAGSDSTTGLYFFDSAGSVDLGQASERLGIEVNALDLSTGSESAQGDCDPVDFAIAYGAAMSHAQKDVVVNFRDDFMPYKGRERRLQSAVKVLSIILTILILAIGVKVHLPLLQKNSDRSKLREKFSEDYLSIMVNKKQLPGSLKTAQETLTDELRRIKQAKSGINLGGKASAQAKLTMVLKAFNKYPGQINLVIDKVSVMEKNVVISGKTSNTKNTLKFYDAIKNEGMEISNVTNKQAKGGGHGFSITVIPKNAMAGKRKRR
ncbi:MAG: hypothetical protein ACYTBP_06160 [Planctomycetota bacterium]